MPAWSVLLAWPLLGERPTWAAVARLVLALIGLVVILHEPGMPLPVPRTLPDLLALLGGFSFALTNILLRQLQEAPSVSRVGAMFTGGALAASGAALLGMWQGAVPAPVVLGVAGTALALVLTMGFLAGNACLQFGASRLPAQTTALVMLSEVLFASVSSVLLDAAELASRTWAGGALIVAAAAWAAWASPRQGDSAAPQSAA
jgi:drug/metabolite transporter (DMT)-like permease